MNGDALVGLRPWAPWGALSLATLDILRLNIFSRGLSRVVIIMLSG